MYLHKKLRNIILLFSLIIIIFFSIAYLSNKDNIGVEKFDISDRGLVIESSVVENELESPSTSNKRKPIVTESLVDNTIVTGMEFFENDTLQQAQSSANRTFFLCTIW